MKISLLYFAKLGDELGSTRENLEIQDGSTLTELIDSLVSRGENWQVLRHLSTNCAVNQDITKDNPVLHDGDEVAFFPPVTGG